MSESSEKRILTNSDLDALVSAVLLKRVEPIGSVEFLAHERIRRGDVSAGERDIIVNMPYVEGCGLWFDHHESNSVPDRFQGRYDGKAPSAARVVYEYYTARGQSGRFEGLTELLEETDRVDSARFKPRDITHPRGAVLLSFLIHSHPNRDGTVSDNRLMIDLLDSGDPRSVLQHETFLPRKEAFLEELEESKRVLQEEIQEDGGIMILDFRGMSSRRRHLCSNKFLPYVLYPESHTLLRLKRLNESRFKITLGFNMFLDGDRCPLHYGHLLAEFDGGGHERAAGCSVSEEEVDEAVESIRNRLTAASAGRPR